MSKNEQDYNSLFYFAPLPCWLYRIDTFKILDVNQAALTHYGYSKEEFLSITIKELRPEEELPRLMATQTMIHDNEGNIYFGVFTHQKKNGERIRMETNGHRINFQGKECMMVIAQDVTKEETKLQQLKESEQRLKAATTIAKLGYWRLDIKRNVFTWTDEVYNIWNKKRETFDATYVNFLETIHPDDREGFEKELQLCFANEKEYNFIHRIYVSDTRVKWVHELGRLVKDTEGNLIAFEGTVQDITASKVEEQRLQLMNRVITDSNDAVLITEAEPFDGPGPRIVYVNKAFTTMTGYTAEEVLGKTPRILQGPHSDRVALDGLKKAMQNWESCEVTTINYKKNGDEFWMNFKVSPVANEHGWYTHWIAIERDVTDQKQKELEQELLGKISLNFTIENDLMTASKKLCSTLINFGKFDLVELWLPNLENKHIQLCAYHCENPKIEKFYEHTKNTKYLEKNEGLPGTVWQMKSSVLWNDIVTQTSFTRSKAAEKVGIRSVLGIPLLFNDDVVGVLMIGTQKEAYFLKKYEKVFEQLKYFIGSEINRKKLENDLNHLYNAIPDILCMVDFQGRFLKMNKAGCELLGYSQEELLYTPFDHYLHPDDKAISAIELNKLQKGDTIFKFENRYITKSGAIVWLNWTSNSVVEERLIYASAKNITTEKNLKELNRQANKMAKIGSWEVDLVQKKVYWSDMVHQLHETDPLTYVPDLDSGIRFYRKDYIESVQQAIATCIATGKAFDFEAPLITAKKNEVWIRAIGNSEFSDGQCKRIYGSFQDITTSKKMEHQISDILKSISDAFYAVDRSWNFTYFNREAERLLGQKEASVIGKNIWQVFPATIGTELEVTYHRVVQSMKPESFDYLFPGDGKWYEINAYPSNGGVAIYFKNIDERKQAAAELEKAYQEKNNILESIGDAFISLNNQWEVTYWNKEAERVLGKNRAVILGKNLWEEYADAIDTDFYRNYHESMKTGKIMNFVEYYATLNKWFEATTYPSVAGLSVYLKDVTTRKESDLRIQQANERFEKVTEATNDAIWDWDLVNHTFYRSNAITKFFGNQAGKYLKEEKFWQDTFHQEDLPRIQESIRGALSDPKVHRWEMEYRIINDKGATLYIIDRGVIVRDSKGKATRMVGAMTDITEHKNYEIQLLNLNASIKQYAHDLEVTNEQLEQFAFIASHDLQEPLRMISSFLDQLKRKYGDLLDEKGHQYIYFATDGAKRMKQIILDLLEYSRAGKLNERKEKIDVNEVLEEYKILRRKIIAEKSAMITALNLPTLTTYKVPLIQTLHCLMDNAIKYSKKDQPPIITFTAEEQSDSWLLKIADNGIGIESQFFEKIFVIFQRLHNREAYPGTGIGLSIAKKHVEAWGGKIGLTSTPEKGSVFYFTVPKETKIIKNNPTI
ncbi:PAS domain S-box protein [Flavobacterium sp. UBA6135]|uniref:PAS domain S-box protein n=1 Tax=Flavobacterium sp. UBA6135 TaxID=1946553 RepID=UPI0025BE4F57|nr:PAS domain S-box protein [Flavobacterium sp. UBA6135]